MKCESQTATLLFSLTNAVLPVLLSDKKLLGPRSHVSIRGNNQAFLSALCCHLMSSWSPCSSIQLLILNLTRTTWLIGSYSKRNLLSLPLWKAHTVTKVQKNAIYSDISDAKMQLDKDRLETVIKKCLCHTKVASCPLIFPVSILKQTLPCSRNIYPRLPKRRSIGKMKKKKVHPKAF